MAAFQTRRQFLHVFWQPVCHCFIPWSRVVQLPVRGQQRTSREDWHIGKGRRQRHTPDRLWGHVCRIRSRRLQSTCSRIAPTAGLVTKSVPSWYSSSLQRLSDHLYKMWFAGYYVWSCTRVQQSVLNGQCVGSSTVSRKACTTMFTCSHFIGQRKYWKFVYQSTFLNRLIQYTVRGFYNPKNERKK